MAENASQGAGSVSRQEFELDVILRSRAEPAFRQRLLADPKAALQETYGVEFPPEAEFQVLEEQAAKFYLVLPFAGSEELTDEQLTAVAGGVGAESDRPYPSSTFASSATFNAFSRLAGSSQYAQVAPPGLLPTLR